MTTSFRPFVSVLGVTIFSVSTATMPAQDLSFLTNGLVAYYPLNGDASDASGNGNDGVVHGAVPAPDRFGVVGGCFSFDGNGQYISASADRLPTTTRTISLWFKANRADNRPGFLGYGGSFCGDSFFFGLNFKGIEAYWISTHCDVYSLVDPYPNAPVNSWHHWTVVTDEAGTRLYVDCELVASREGVTETYVEGTELGLGTVSSPDGHTPYIDGNIGYLDGYLDEIRLYDRALPLAEIQQLCDEAPVGLTNTAPTITAQPAATNVFVGDSATLMVSVVGTRPLAYQWRKDGGNMNGKTSATLTLANVTLTDSGEYTVVVTNDFGSVTSAVARVTVTATKPPTDAAVFDLREDWSETSNPNGVWTLLSGTEIVPRIRANTSIDPFSPTQGGLGYEPAPFWFKSTSTPLFVHDWQSGDIIVHTATVGSDVPDNVIWTSPLNGQIEISGGLWEGRDWADAGGGFRENQWNLYVRDILISSGTIAGGDPYSSANPFPFSLGSGGASSVTGIQVSRNDVVRLELARTGVWGDYVGVNFRIATVSPLSLTILRNDDQTVSLSWTGAGALEQTESLSAPNWQRAPSQANPQVISTVGAMKFYRLKAESPPRPPSIVVQPQSKAAILGESVTFSLTAVGSLPLSYQWSKDGQDISGASQATYSIAAVQPNHLGAYTAIVTNQYGAETSKVAHLTQIMPECPTSQYRFEEGVPDQPATGDGSILDFVDRSGDGTATGDPMYRADVGWPRVAACQCESNTRSLELVPGQSVKFNSPFIFHDQYGDATLEFLVKPAEQQHVGLFWTRPDNEDRDRFNIHINPNGGFGFDYRAPSGELHIPTAAGILFQIPVDTWSHIAVVRDTQSSAPAHSYDVYVNGVHTTTAFDDDPDLPTSDQAWQISGRDGFHFTGSVDEIRFTARKLTPDEFLISEKICPP